MSGRASSKVSRWTCSPRKSAGRTSMVVFGQRLRVARTVAAQTEAPPSLRSSRATEVMTTCFRFISAMDSATRAGSPRSSSLGRPESTAQKVQERVQTLPRIITVALPRDQHSPMLGHCADWQTVWSLCSSTFFLVSRKSGPLGSLARSQSGLRADSIMEGGQHCRPGPFFNLTKKKGCLPFGKHPFCYEFQLRP